jgi:drug/metabolite transporter (DMT)-like permease
MRKNIIISSLATIVASIFFVINDAVINFLAPLNIKFYHFVFYGLPAYICIPLYLLVSGELKKKMKVTSLFIPLLRGIIFIPLPFLGFIALKNISLPEFTTINMSVPIFAGLLSIFILKEKINLYIISSIVLGLIGVILVIQPGFESFNIYYLVALSGAFLITLNTILVNKFNNVTTSIGYYIYGGCFIHLISIVLFFFDPLKINLNIFVLITLASILINLAIFLSVFAFKLSQKFFASISCLIYLQIFWSSLIGLVIFDEYLNNFGFIGAFFIILSGIISIPGQFKQINE